MDRGRRFRSNWYGDDSLGRSVWPASTNSSPARARSNNDVDGTLFYSPRIILRSLSPGSSITALSSNSTRLPDALEYSTASKPYQATNVTPDDGAKPTCLRATVPKVSGAHFPGRPLRRIADCASEKGMDGLTSTTSLGATQSKKETYLVKVCRTLMMYGAPTHRLEQYMQRTADVLEIPLQSFYMPGCMIISFNATAWRSNEVQLVRCTQTLNLSKLYDVHAVYKAVIHKKMPLEEATAKLDGIISEDDKFPKWLLVPMYGLASACIGPVSYGARPIDLPIIFLLGSLLGFMEMILAERSELYAQILEISATISISFLARGFGSIRWGDGNPFCFSAICQSSIVLLLPGFTITNSTLELQSKNIVSGSVRIVYGIIYTLFLAFGIMIGTTLYGSLDSDASSATKCNAPWPFWWQVIFVPLFTFCWVVINQGKWIKQPAMVILSLTGWLVNHFSAQYFVTNAPISQALGALTIGILTNLYSRLGHEFAAALLHPAIFIQVPGSLAASGSLISGIETANQLTHHGNGVGTGESALVNTTVLNAGYAMIEIAIGITVGLSVSALVVYPFRKRHGKSGLFSF